ncbi:hypothetical protein GN956_G1222 [Arapaima gigas]
MQKQWQKKNISKECSVFVSMQKMTTHSLPALTKRAKEKCSCQLGRVCAMTSVLKLILFSDHSGFFRDSMSTIKTKKIHFKK